MRRNDTGQADVRMLTFSTLFPNPQKAHHGIFVETRLRHLLADGAVRAQVVAPVPWFPFRHRLFGRYADNAAVPREEIRHGIRVLHPRYPMLPKIGMTLTPVSLARAAIPAVRRLLAEGYDFDLIDAHYFYPDGIAAVMLGREFGRPVVITARGTDINLIPRYYWPRRWIQWAAREAAALVAVCQALKDALTGLGVPAEKISVLRNGVDLELFSPGDRAAIRARLGLARRTLLSVGHLIERKGHHLAVEALSRLPDMELLIVGEGEEETSLRRLAQRLGVSGRVRFVGALPQAELASYYRAADALVLASSREGWANVLLEAMACGTPVVAANVWGTPEVVAAPEAGVLMEERSPEALAQAVRRLFADYPDRQATRRYAESFGWDATTRGQLDLFRAVLARTEGGHGRGR